MQQLHFLTLKKKKLLIPLPEDQATLAQILYLLHTSTWRRYSTPVWRCCLGDAPAESVTTSWSSRCCWHQRRSSWGTQLLVVVCVRRQAKRAGWKNFPQIHSSHFSGSPLCKHSSGLCIWERRRSLRLNTACMCKSCASALNAVSGYQPQCFGKILLCICLGFFRSVFLSQPEFKLAE